MVKMTNSILSATVRKKRWMYVKRFFPREMALDVLNSKRIKQSKWTKEERHARVGSARLQFQHVVCLCRTWRCLSKRMNNAAVQRTKTWLSVGSEIPCISVNVTSWHWLWTAALGTPQGMNGPSATALRNRKPIGARFSPNHLFYKRFWTLNLSPNKLTQVVTLPICIREGPVRISVGTPTVVTEGFVVFLSPCTNIPGRRRFKPLKIYTGSVHNRTITTKIHVLAMCLLPFLPSC
jgi:hypothetical protein